MIKKLEEHLIKHNISPYTLHNIASISLMCVVLLVNKIGVLLGYPYVTLIVTISIQMSAIIPLLKYRNWFSKMKMLQAPDRKDLIHPHAYWYNLLCKEDIEKDQDLNDIVESKEYQHVSGILYRIITAKEALEIRSISDIDIYILHDDGSESLVESSMRVKEELDTVTYGAELADLRDSNEN